LYKGETDTKRAVKLIPLLYDADPANFSDAINQRIEEYPSAIDSETLKAAIDGGFFVPSDFAQTVINIGNVGFFD
jgi:hypothetical protein